MAHLNSLFNFHLLFILSDITKVDGKSNQKDCCDDQYDGQKGCHPFLFLLFSGIDRMKSGIIIVGKLLRISFHFYPSSDIEFGRQFRAINFKNRTILSLVKL